VTETIFCEACGNATAKLVERVNQDRVRFACPCGNSFTLQRWLPDPTLIGRQKRHARLH